MENGYIDCEHCNNDLSASEFNELAWYPFSKTVRVKLYRSANFDERIRRVRIKGNKCYNSEEFASIRFGNWHRRNGAIMVCNKKDCSGKCKVVHRKDANKIENVTNDIGGNGQSFAWLRLC
ncbi:hypothetical protein AX774_g7220 [Zancudomyces culisetae]|uniref:Uncharacterized protein n=1 Tax=Zancudomyces culisetae TaxID=1213189 RepID=A0A1R1PEE0_ZANCU|nr:hypothetical protein AX774_g7220 [Zancudomyces culisetae]|eukprot:OMH79360.1 hypothetical protein AX774_g7220 [Zancudomyces culisetae]